jgi:hypothetical protein
MHLLEVQHVGDAVGLASLAERLKEHERAVFFMCAWFVE